jgi:alanyl-tRNA synthetase
LFLFLLSLLLSSVLIRPYIYIYISIQNHFSCDKNIVTSFIERKKEEIVIFSFPTSHFRLFITYRAYREMGLSSIVSKASAVVGGGGGGSPQSASMNQSASGATSQDKAPEGASADDTE